MRHEQRTRSTLSAVVGLAACAACCAYAGGDVGATGEPAANADRFFNPSATAKAATPELFPGVVIQPINARGAYQLKSDLKDRVLFVDVRSRLAAINTGMPAGIDVHIPFAEPAPGYRWNRNANEYQLQYNRDFARDIGAALIARGLSFDDPVVLICADGVRARQASEHLADSGYGQIFVVTDGFDMPSSRQANATVKSWKQAGLPWTPVNTAVLYRVKP
jgi:rhodanese-related sulfurtransferase